MSRIGKKPVSIPEGVEVEQKDDTVKMKGPLGEMSLKIPPFFKVEIKDNFITVIPQKQNKDTSAIWGTTRALINNYLLGVKEGFSKELVLKGVGFRVDVDGDNLVLKIGYINPVYLPIPKELDVKAEKNVITVKGISKEQVGQFAAMIKLQKPVEPYKGKGIHYKGQFIRRKSGKKLTGTTA